MATHRDEAGHMATLGGEPVVRRQAKRSLAPAACEACRKLKMRCIRPESREGESATTEPCERCKRNDSTCTIPRPRPLGRRPGAVGRYRGVEKALRLMRSELGKARSSPGGGQSFEGFSIVPNSQGDFLELVPLRSANLTFDAGSSRTPEAEISEPTLPSTSVPESSNTAPMAEVAATQSPNEEASPQQRDHDSISNPLGLLADVSGAAQALELQSVSSRTPPSAQASSSYATAGPEPRGLARSLLHRPGYVSLGLKLSKETLEYGLDALFTAERQEYPHSHYFRPAETTPASDTGPDVDPIELGLISMDTVYYLFPIYFARLHPINGILDPILHTPEFVRSRSALLFTWILAITAQSDTASSSIVKRLRLHGEKLSKHVHTCGYKSVEIVQGYYISLLYATPASTMAEERSWLYTTHAFGLAAELGLDQGSRSRYQSTTAIPMRASSSIPQSQLENPVAIEFRESQQQSMSEGQSETPVYDQRLARNRERTWLRILLWEQANGAACGRMNTFPETELTLNADNWWLHPLADPADKYTCAFIVLRRLLAALHNELRRQGGLSHHSSHHWARELVDTRLDHWCQSWLSSSDAAISPMDQISNIFLRYVYKHGRLWTLSFALYCSSNGHDDIETIKEDCFNAAVNCCEEAVRDLQEIGEPLYCMLAPTWAMISYAAVIALKLFPSLHGTRAGSEVELLALLSQVSLQLERAGTTPPQRLGIAAILGQHLWMILQSRATVLKDTLDRIAVDANMSFDPTLNTGMETGNEHDDISETQQYGPMMSGFDPFLIPSSIPDNEDITGDGFAEMLRELFGQGFGGIS